MLGYINLPSADLLYYVQENHRLLSPPIRKPAGGGSSLATMVHHKHLVVGSDNRRLPSSITPHQLARSKNLFHFHPTEKSSQGHWFSPTTCSKTFLNATEREKYSDCQYQGVGMGLMPTCDTVSTGVSMEEAGSKPCPESTLLYAMHRHLQRSQSRHRSSPPRVTPGEHFQKGET